MGGHVTRSTKLFRLALLIVTLAALAAACAGWGWDDSAGTGDAANVPAAIG
jgi:hypothetical protein